MKKSRIKPNPNPTVRESISVEVEFIDTDKPTHFAEDHLSIDFMGGYAFPIYSTSTSVFYPSALIINTLNYHAKNFYVGDKVQFTAFSVFDNNENYVNNHYGLFVHGDGATTL